MTNAVLEDLRNQCASAVNMARYYHQSALEEQKKAERLAVLIAEQERLVAESAAFRASGSLDDILKGEDDDTKA